jgi:hypothetical protein
MDRKLWYCRRRQEVSFAVILLLGYSVCFCAYKYRVGVKIEHLLSSKQSGAVLLVVSIVLSSAKVERDKV